MSFFLLQTGIRLCLLQHNAKDGFRSLCANLLGFFFFLRFYLFIHERHRERERQRHRQREKQAPYRKPDVGLDPESPGSHPGLQEVLNRCTTGAALEHAILDLRVVGSSPTLGIETTEK